MEPNTPLNSVTISTEEYIRLVDAERDYQNLMKQIGKITAKLPSSIQQLFLNGEVTSVRTIQTIEAGSIDVVLTFRRTR